MLVTVVVDLVLDLSMSIKIPSPTTSWSLKCRFVACGVRGVQQVKNERDRGDVFSLAAVRKPIDISSP